jgi:hypothetical protein
MRVNYLVGASGYQPAVAAAYNISNSAGSGSSPVSVSVSFVDAFGVGQLPAGGAYAVAVCPSQACFVSVSSKTSSGFTVTLTPLSSGSIASGSFDALVHS